MKNTTEATMASTTNLMPDLAPWDYEALKASIDRVGVIVPVFKDEYDDTIDGFQRGGRAENSASLTTRSKPSPGSPTMRSGTMHSP